MEEPALGVSVKSVRFVAGSLGFISGRVTLKTSKNIVRIFPASCSTQAESAHVLVHACCLSCIVH